MLQHVHVSWEMGFMASLKALEEEVYLGRGGDSLEGHGISPELRHNSIFILYLPILLPWQLSLEKKKSSNEA